ncbi:MAG: extracellular solute-binding protein [Armatimonadetes bacterium]|nr:extracellular solute-binding protein [Armatimonadota bacterium]
MRLLVALVALFAVAHAQETRLIVWGLSLGEEQQGLAAQIKEFERRNPDIKVQLLSMGAGRMNPQKLMTAIVGKAPPDVIFQDRFTIGDWASRSAFRALDDLIERDKHLKEGVRQDDYYPACWNEAVYKGKVYAVPAGTDDRALLYNRAIFREVGLDPDRPPRTWDELLEYGKKLTKRNKNGQLERIGFIPNFGNSWLYLYSWQNEGEFMSPDGRTCTINNPQTREALEFMVRVYKELGGINEIDKFQSGFLGREQDPFFVGKVAMKIDGDWVLNGIARYAPDLDFAAAPPPVPTDRYHQRGRFAGKDRFITWNGGFSYAIPAGSRNVEAAWKFVKWMAGVESALISSEAQAAYYRTKGRMYVPRFSANMRVNEAVYAQYMPKDPKFRQVVQTYIDLLPVARFRPVTFVGQRLWDEHVRAFDQAVHLVKSPEAALAESQSKVQRELDKVYSRESNPIIEWRPVLISLGLLGLFLTAYLVSRWRSHRLPRMAKQEAYYGYAFVSPWLIGFLAFTAGPMIASLMLSFCDYDVLHPARWVGLNNYALLLTEDYEFLSKAFYNAFYLAVIGIPLNMATGLAIAMLLNTGVSGMTGYRTAYYMPAIVPTIAAAVLWGWALSGDPSRGLINAAWQATLTEWFGWTPPGWFSVPEWAKPGLIVMGLWGAGGGMILWLAGLQGIPQHLYEAAEIDGASKAEVFRRITLPMLSPYVFFNLIMGTIGALQEFDRIYVLGGGQGGSGPVDSMLVPVMYLFSNAFTYFKMGYASALAWIIFAIILALTLIQFKLAPRWVHYEAEKRG